MGRVHRRAATASRLHASPSPRPQRRRRAPRTPARASAARCSHGAASQRRAPRLPPRPPPCSLARGSRRRAPTSQGMLISVGSRSAQLARALPRAKQTASQAPQAACPAHRFRWSRCAPFRRWQTRRRCTFPPCRAARVVELLPHHEDDEGEQHLVDRAQRLQAGADGLARGQQRLVVEARVGGAQPGDREDRSSPAPPGSGGGSSRPTSARTSASDCLA